MLKFPIGKGCKMLTGNADIVLANLDWLMVHEDCKLDYQAGVVLDPDGNPEYLVSDLATPGLTPATRVCYIHGVTWPECPDPV